jgi:hypothetical protein
MTPRELAEYSALRATILERGTARHWIFIAGLGLWAALTVAVAAVAAVPVATLLPLLFLAATFETIFALHTAVERIGRYLQVFHENHPDEAAWEHTAMAYGRSFRGGGIDALFSPIFWVATLFNAIPVALAGPAAIDWVVVGAVHLLFAWRVWMARRQSALQRAIDLDRFAQLKAGTGQRG